MTDQEVETVARIMIQADGGCYVCGGYLFNDFNKAFPGHGEILDRVWGETNKLDKWRRDDG